MKNQNELEEFGRKVGGYIVKRRTVKFKIVEAILIENQVVKFKVVKRSKIGGKVIFKT